MNEQTVESNALTSLPEKQITQALKACAEQIQRCIQNNNEIEKVYNKVFLIRSNDIRQVYEIVTQRLSNDSDKINALNFTVTVASTRDNFRKYSDINTFLNDIETRDIEPINIQLEWSMLVRFSGDSPAEKQDISVIMTKPDYGESDDFDREFVFVYKGRPIFGNGAIIISIENTNKIWALDILSHIENWISKNVKKPTIEKKHALLYKNRKIVKDLVKILAEICPYALFVYASARLYFKHSDQALLAKEFSLFILICSILAVYNFFEKKLANSFAVIISNLIAGLLPRSFFILSSEDEEKYKELLKEINGKGYSAWMYIVVPIILNIVSSIIFVSVFEKILK